LSVIVRGSKVETFECRFCHAKIFPEATWRAHELRHQDTGLRECKNGHIYQARDLGEWKVCTQCRSEAVKKSHRRLSEYGGRPRGDNYRPRKARERAGNAKTR
jgi:hypothetical protein